MTDCFCELCCCSHSKLINILFFFIVQSTLTTADGFVVNPSGNTLVIGSDTCFAESLRIRCQTTPPVDVMWTRDGVPVAGNEFIDVTQPGEYMCSGPDGCGQTLSASSDVLVGKLRIFKEPRSSNIWNY